MSLDLMVVRSPGNRSPAAMASLSAVIGEALKLKDRYPAGTFSYVVNKATMLPVWQVLEYLTHCKSVGGNVKTTIKNKADACRELLLYLDAIEVPLTEACQETLIELRERLGVFISAKTGRPLASGTVKLRIKVAAEFLQFHDRISREEGSALKVPVKRPLVEYLGDEDLRRLLAALGEPPDQPGGRRSRDWMIAVFCVSTGARVGEALGLTDKQVLDVECSDSGVGRLFLDLVETKGSKPRRIVVEREVIRWLVAYIDGERAAAVAIGRESRPHSRDTAALFVNGPDCAASYAGLPYQEKRAQEFFALRQVEIGMVRSVPVFDLDPVDDREAKTTREVSKHVLHHLRHTYAIRAFHAYRDMSDKARWMKLQAQLGHENHETTANIYLRAVAQSEAAARDVLGGFLKKLVALP